MSRKVLSSFLIVSLLVGLFLVINPFPIEKVSAEEYRNGYMLTPVTFDSTGVSISSKFIFKSQNEISIDDLKLNLSIDGEPMPDISDNSSNSFTVAPSRDLEQNKLYTFRMKRSSEEDITWTFQTSSVFRVISSFPGNKTQGVPTNTGIEISFSHDNFENINDYFNISPSVNGTFERHKLIAVFVPEKLKEGTLYTVTLKKGLKLSGTKYSLTDDYIFKFETSSDKNGEGSYPSGQFNYNKSLGEYTPREKPAIPINYYVNTNKYKGSTAIVSTEIYGYSSLDSFINALDKKNSVPSWAYINYQKNILSTNKLEKVADFTQEFPVDSSTQQFVKIPQILPVGYYLVDSKWKNDHFQTLIQVTDIGMYLSKSDTKTIIWLNDLLNKNPIQDATVIIIGGNKEYKSDAEGITCFDTLKSKNESNDVETSDYSLLKILTKDNKSALMCLDTFDYGTYYGSSSSQYWNYIYLDRNLYKPDDTIQFWGFLKSRYSNEDVDSLTLEFGQGNRYYNFGGPISSKSINFFPTAGQPMVRQSIKVQNGLFKGSFDLPSPDPGGYQLTIKNGDEIVASTYVTVQNYVKPPYKLEITKDKEALFPGDSVKFNLKASFFEGTGLPDLSVNISGDVSDNRITDSNGEINVKYTANPSKEQQGENSASINCNATLPEIGEISQSNSVRVFVNDINVNISSVVEKDKKIIKALVNKIVLDRLNNGTAKDDSDYLGNAVGGKLLEGKIIKNTWVRIYDGQYYDYINKVTQKRYRYELKTETVKNFSMTTNNEGKASYEFDGKDFSDGYYTAQISCFDNSKREMNFKEYLGTFYDSSFYNNYDDNRYYLDGGKENYSIDDKVALTFKKGKTNLPNGKYLFIKSQNGIREYSQLSTPTYSFNLEQKDIPNTYVTGVYFNGKTYVESEIYNVVYDYSNKNLIISASLDKTSYKPGDTAVININAKDKSGAYKKAYVNVSIVDEALFSLSDQQTDTLSSLYSQVNSGINYTYKSHFNSDRQNIIYARNSMKEMYFGDVAKSVNSSSMVTAVREDFRDTAHFEAVTLDEKGHGEIKFKLPDNITSWRITLTGVTTDLLGGSNTCTLKVSLPFFMNYSLNSTYLTGDKPTLGVNAYGSELKKGENINFEVYSTNTPNNIISAKGKAFERVDIPLWKLSEGEDNIIIKASTNSGLYDSMQQKIKVVDSYHQSDRALYYNLTPGLKFQGGLAGNTSLVFSDQGRGRFLPQLTSLMYPGGNRVDQQFSANIATSLIQKYFKYDDIQTNDSFKVTDYQTKDGGMALLPYGSSDADLSAKMVSLIKDKVNIQKLKDYFYSILYGDSPGLKGNALYGLAVLREPILLELDKAAQVEDKNVKDSLFIALAYSELGETHKAATLYNDLTSKYLQDLKPFYRINVGQDKDDILEYTALASVLAAKLNTPEKQGLYDYCISNSPKDILINIENLLYIDQEINNCKEDTAKFTYTLDGGTHTEILTGGRSCTITLPSLNLSHLKIESVEGNVSMVSLFKDNLVKIDKTDKEIGVSRKYYTNTKRDKSKTSFNQGDIVLVEIKCDIGSKSLAGGYEVTDYLPSGLKAIENQSKFGLEYQKDGCYSRIDGQKVTFYAYKHKDGSETFSYYARVISPGTFTADSPIIQGIKSRESINIGKTELVTIN